MATPISSMRKDSIDKLSYTELISLVNETNKPPGGKSTVHTIARGCFLSSKSRVLEIGCNTGFTSIELAACIGCSVIGVDVSEACIETATANSARAGLSERVKFHCADAQSLRLDSYEFDLVFCGGALAWMKDPLTGLREAARATKQWGYIAMTPLWYNSPPAPALLQELKSTIGVQIKDWGREFWLNIGQEVGLELFSAEDCSLKEPSDGEVSAFVDSIVDTSNLPWPATSVVCLKERLNNVFGVFTRNNRHCKYSRIIFRKRPFPEQASLYS